MSAVVWTIFSTALLRNWDENWPFPILWPLLGFPNLLTYWVQHLIASFRILNSSAGIPSPALALLTAVLHKTYLTSHSRMSGSGCVATPSWLLMSLRSFLYIDSMYSFYLFLVSSTSIRSLLFLSFIVPIFGWNVPLIFPVFLTRSLVFSLLLFSSISLHCSLKKAFLSLLAFLWNSTFSWVYLSLSSLLFTSLLQLFVKPPQTTTLPSCFTFSLGWFCSLPPVQYYRGSVQHP